MTTAIEVLTPSVKVSGADLSSAALNSLIGVRVERGYGLVGRVTLRFTDPGYALSASNTFQLGSAVIVGVVGAGTLIEATVTGVSLEHHHYDHAELVVVADDAAYKLTRGTQTKSFLTMPANNVIEQVASTAGLTATVSMRSTEVQNYLLQGGTALEFIDSLATRAGCVWWVDGTTLTVNDAGTSSATVALALTDTLYDFSVHASALHPTEANVLGWDPAQQANVSATGSSASTGVSAQATFISDYLTGAQLPSASVDAGDRAVLSQDEAATTAKALYDQWAAGAVQARGTCAVNSKLGPGVTVEVSQAGPTSGSYLISKVEHVYSRSGFQTRFTAGSHHRTGLVDLLRPQPATAGLSISGLVIGVVTAIADPDSQGRVKVKYGGLDQQVESPWARVVAVGAGTSRGTAFLPEVNDEVLVGFEHGDTRRPIVIGGLYSAQNTLADYGVKDSKVSTRRITSRTGHVLELSDGDSPDTSHVLLQLGTTTHKLRLGKDRFDIAVGSGIPVLIQAGSAKFELTDAGDVNIAGNNVNITAQAKLNLQGVQVAMKADSQLDVQGAMVSVKGSGTAAVEASGPLTLKGAIVAIN